MPLETSAALPMLALRARIKARIRAFFAARGVLEVDTPALAGAATPDPAIESVAATVRALQPRALYLHTSPEYAMKRLLSAGSGDIYQICRVYRDDELGRWHQPEFLMLEWYRLGFTELELMDEVAELVAVVMRDCGRPLAIEKITYRTAFERAIGIDPHGDLAALEPALRARGIDVPANLAGDGLLDLALSTAVVATFARDRATIIHDYPASQAALAEIKQETPPVAARFEVFVGSIELANGFRELTDAAEQARRFAAELDARRRAGRACPPLDLDFLEALSRLPACAGVALGLDRLVALAAGADELAAALTFVHRR